ncbi:MAG: hypothetical protein OER86_09920, partial [Phycisphaerae bacterium]|nr:hypothetical protein [Phycisphaerae bacterium]
MAEAGPNSADGGGGKTLYLIDGHAQIFRAYHAIRSLSSPVTKEPTNATFGFVGMLIKLFRDRGPDYVVMTIDASGDRGTFRSQIDPQYKANRDAPPEDLAPQVQRIVQICELWGIPVLAAEGVEADDTIATVCEMLGDEQELNIRIVSRDKDLHQLLGPRVQMYDIHRDESLDVATLKEEKGISPEQVVDMLSLMGDNVDNIPGAKGVGPKTAAKLIAQYGDLDQLLAHTQELSGKLRQNIEAAAERLPMNRELVALRKDVPIDFNLASAVAEPPTLERLLPVFEELGFGRHVRDLTALAAGTQVDPPSPAAAPAPAGPTGGLFDQLETDGDAVSAPQAEKGDFRLVACAQDLKQAIQAARQSGGVLAVDTETDRLDPMQAQLCGVSLSWQAHDGVYIPVRSANPAEHLDAETVTAQLRPLLEDPGILKVGQNLKYDMIVLRRAGIDLAGPMFDTMVAAYLIDATRSSYKLDNLALAYLGYRMIPITDLLGSGRNQRSMIDLPASTVTDYAAEDAEVTLRLRDHFLPRLEEMDLSDLLADLEMPLVPVLAEMEFNGIRVDPQELDQQKGTIQTRIAELHDQVMEVSGASFNPDSPKQLGEVLFKQLGCKVI